MAENKIPDLKNGALIEAMNAIKQEENPATQTAFVTAAIRSSFFVPADILDANGTPLEGNGMVELPMDSKINFRLIKNTNGENFFPIFTDVIQLQKWTKDQKVKSMVMNFTQMSNLTLQKQPDEVKGFVINPMDHNLIFTRENLENIQNVLRSGGEPPHEEKQVKVLFGKPVSIPDSVLDSFRKTLSKNKEVNAVYFLMMKQGESESYLFVFDIDPACGDPKKIADSFCASARLFLSKYPVLSAPLNSPIGESAPKVTEPFYTKE